MLYKLSLETIMDLFFPFSYLVTYPFIINDSDDRQKKIEGVVKTFIPSYHHLFFLYIILTTGKKKVVYKRVTVPFLHKHGVNEVLMIFRNVDNYSLSKIHSFSGNSFYAASQVFY